jgi:predicted nucleic acid-binding protein
MLLDSNTIIYATIPEKEQLRQFLSKQDISVSAVSYVEVLGYHKLSSVNKQHFENFFQTTQMFPISDEVIEKASILRQQKKMSLGDALIAATALIHGLTLVTSNVKDFEWIEDLSVLDPLKIAPKME